MANDDAIWIPVLPSMRGFARAFNDGMRGVDRDGRRAGERAGQSFADGIASAQRKVERASQVLARARDREADAAGKVRVAEEQLNALRSRGVTDAGRIAAAEERVASSRRRAESAGRQTQAADQQLGRARNDLRRATDDSTRSQDQNTEAAGRGNRAMRAAGEGAGFLGSKLGGMAKLAAGAAAGFAGFQGAKSILTSGWDRLQSIDDARGKLTGLGHDAKSTETIMQSAMDSVKGTAYGFGDAAGIAAGAVAAGVKPGAELTQYLTRIGDASAIAGVGLSEMGSILNKVQTGQSAYAAELNQLADRGIPIYQWIAKEAGVAAGDVKKMAAEGKVSSELYFAAIDKNIGGAAKNMDTVSMAASNTKAAFGRLGATLLEPIFERAKGGLTGLTGLIDQATEKAGPMADKLAGGMRIAGDVLTTVATVGAPILVDVLGTLWDAFQRGVDIVSSVVGFLDQHKTTLGIVAGVITAFFLPALITSGATMAANAITIGVLTTAFKLHAMFTRGVAIATGVWTAAQTALNFAMSANPIGVVIAIVVALVAAIVLAYRNSETFRNIVQAAWQGIQTAASWAWDNVLKPVIDGFMAGLGWLGDKGLWLWQNVMVPAWDAISAGGQAMWGFVKPILDKFGSAISTVGDIAGKVAGGIKSAFSGVVDVLKAPVRFLGGLLAKIPTKIGPITVPGAAQIQSWGQTLQSLRTGGPVAGRRGSGELYGPGTDRSDSILGVGADGLPTAFVSAGEFVMNGWASRRFGPLLAMLNAGGRGADRVMDALRGVLPARADGGPVSADALVDFAKGVEGQPYEWGGVNWGDCSGAVSALANKATGRDPFGSRFATGTMGPELEARGFKPGLGPAGSLNIGWYNGGPYGGHTSATLPDGTAFEMGGARGNGQFGGGAAGADDPQYTDHMHLPPEHFGGLDAGAPTTGDSGALTAGGSSSGGGMSGANIGGGTSSFGNSGGKSAFNSAKDAQKGGVTVVWVENWPGGLSGTSGADSSVSVADSGAATATPAASGASTSEPEPVKVADPFVKFATGVDMNTVREAQLSSEPYKASDAGGWFEDPQASALDALFEVLGMSDVVKADDVLPSMESRYGVAGPDHSAPVRPAGEGAGGNAAPTQVVGTVVHGDVNVTDYDEFRDRQEKDEKRAMAKAGM
ncbi:tail length tape measure protein [Gordonia phage Splinter]|uniref:Tape measure protein n=2 Tax=Vendettavirus vendetta TaxID=2049886 RepID=A0A160DCZ9_9CAUD|nr:tail length tape measure protein [Gordonia phage Vendetta]YP_009275375.1 tail length tape measure protein [Gordonia phage Splinter]ANA85568.1 tape measure protein [Gordonia phage Vendetta]ANA85647.1 tape measure protein [Gordonia phage Splinter]